MSRKSSTHPRNFPATTPMPTGHLVSPECRYVEETSDCHYTVPEIENYFRKQPSEKRALAFVSNTGLGLRQGLVSLFFGSKGDIVVMGKALKEIALSAAARFIGLLPADDWLAYSPIDLVIYWDDADSVIAVSRPLKDADMVVLGIPGMEQSEDPPLPSIFAARRRCLQELENETCRCLHYCGISTEKFDPLNKAIWWALLIRPTLLTAEQWKVASGNGDFSNEAWKKIWKYAQEFASRMRISTLTLNAVSTNVNSNGDVYALYQRVIGCDQRFNDRDRVKVMDLFEVPDDNVVASKLSGNIRLGKQCLVRKSTISINQDICVRMGTGVVIDDSIICIVGHPGREYVIPEGTVIANCCISGELREEGRNGALIGVESTTGIRFQTAAVQTTVFLKNGQQRTGEISFRLFPKHCMDNPVPGLQGLSLRHVLVHAESGYKGPKKRFTLDDTE